MQEMQEAKKTEALDDRVWLLIQGDNFKQQLNINKNLTIANLRATIEYDYQKAVTLKVGQEKLTDQKLISTLNNNDIITIVDRLDTAIMNCHQKNRQTADHSTQTK